MIIVIDGKKMPIFILLYIHTCIYTYIHTYIHKDDQITESNGLNNLKSFYC